MKIIDLIYNIDTKRFKFKDDDIEILYYKQERNTRDNVNFKLLQKCMNRIIKTFRGSNALYYNFTINNKIYHIEFERS